MALLSNIKVLWITIVILILLNLTTLGALWITRNHRPIPRKDNNRHSRELYLRDKLNLNADQMEKYIEIKTNHKKELFAKLDTIRNLREHLMCQMQKRDMNDSTLILIDKIGMEQSDIERINYRHFREILNLCDSNQKTVFIETMKKAFLPDHDRDRSSRGDRSDDPDKK